MVYITFFDLTKWFKKKKNDDLECLKLLGHGDDKLQVRVWLKINVELRYNLIQLINIKLGLVIIETF